MKRKQAATAAAEPKAPAPPQERRVLVSWRCPECMRTQTGWVLASDGEPRICCGVLAKGGKCGAVMQEFYRGRG